jgi:hypothetical protein
MQAANGTLWVVYQSNRITPSKPHDIFYNTSSDNGASWSSGKRLTTNLNEDVMPSITQLSNGSIWVVWSSNRTGNREIFYKTSHDNGQNWSLDTQLTNNPDQDMRPSIMQAKNLTIWVTWASNRTGNSEIWYKTSQNYGATWSNDTQLTADPSQDTTPSITQARNETIWVVWSSNRIETSNYEIFYKTYSSSTWSLTDTRLTYNSDFDNSPSIMQAKDRTMWVAWQRTTPGNPPTTNLYYMILGGANPSETQLTSSGIDMGPSIIQGKTDVWVAYSSEAADYELHIFYKTTRVEAYDVGIRSIFAFTPPISIPMNRTYQSRLVNITIDVINWGSVQETFDVSTYYNGTLFGTQTVSNLAPGDSKKLYFPWYTDQYDLGYYGWSANATQVPNETYQQDNSLALNPSFRLKMEADIDGDNLVDITDATLMSTFFGLPYSSYPDEDINGDAVINILDAVLVMVNWSPV